jgi:hypothetical protein
METKKMTIVELVEMLDLDIVTRRYSGQGGRISASLSCSGFEQGSIIEFKDEKDSGVSTHLSGSGYYHRDAVENLCKEISGKVLTITIMGREKITFKLPEEISH